MPIYNELWEEEDFKFRPMMNLQGLPANHIKRLSLLRFDFVEYKANQLLACHLYDRMNQHCRNQYGVLEDSIESECMDNRSHLNTCVRLNAAYGLHRKYFPELFLRDPYSRPVPHINELGVI